MPASMAIMDFVQRFQQIQAHRDTSDGLIKDLLIYCEHIESGLCQENALLKSQLEDAQLELEDTRRSRRDLQRELNLTMQKIEYYTADCDSMRVRPPPRSLRYEVVTAGWTLG